MNQPAFFAIGKKKTENLYALLAGNDRKVKRILLLGDRTTFALGGDRIAGDLQARGLKITRRVVYDSSDPEVARIVKIIRRIRPDLVIGFGGGKVLDVAKLAAGRTKKRFISIPTTLSNDGIASPVSVIKNSRNLPVSHLTAAPYGLIVDIDIVKKAPLRYIKAGVGDLLSNLSAVFDARLSRSRMKIHERVSRKALGLAENGARQLLDCRDRRLKSDRFLQSLTRGLIKSGLAMCDAGSSLPSSGGEHKISHALDYLFPARKTLHGEQAGFAALYTMALQQNKYARRVRELYTRIGFPSTLRRIGIRRGAFIDIIMHARSIRPNRYTILEEKDLTRKEIGHLLKKIKI